MNLILLTVKGELIGGSDLSLAVLGNLGIDCGLIHGVVSQTWEQKQTYEKQGKKYFFHLSHSNL